MPGLDGRRGHPPCGAVDRHPHRDLPQPAGEPLRLAQLRDPLEHVQEHLLRQLERIARVAQPAQRDRVNRWLELLDQRAERLAVANLRLTDHDRQLSPGRFVPVQNRRREEHVTHLPHTGVLPLPPSPIRPFSPEQKWEEQRGLMNVVTLGGSVDARF